MQDCIEIVGVNDLASPEILSYLLTHDSVHQCSKITQSFDEKNFIFNGYKIPFFQYKTPKEIEICGADVVIEASGLFLTQGEVESHLQKAQNA